MGSAQARPAGRLVGIALVNVATLAWATNMALGRWMRHDIGPITIAAARFFVASVVYALMLQRQPRAERRLGSDRRILFIMGLCGVAIFVPVLYLGLRYTTTVNATLINGLAPIVTAVLAVLLIQEPMTRRQAAGTVVAFAGVVFLISGGSLEFWRTAGLNIGDLIMLGGISLWSLYSVLARRAMRHRSTLSVSAWSSFLGLPFLLLAAIWEVHALPVHVTPRLILLLLYIGIVPSVIGFLAWNESIRRLGSSGAMVFYNTLPLYGALIGFLFLGETIGTAHLVGGALIIAGGLWSAQSDQRVSAKRSGAEGHTLQAAASPTPPDPAAVPSLPDSAAAAPFLPDTAAAAPTPPDRSS